MTIFGIKHFLISMFYMFCFCFLLQQGVRDIIKEHYVDAAGVALGALGWAILYLRYMRGIKKQAKAKEKELEKREKELAEIKEEETKL